MSHHTKKQSQLERIILFTDAVFAIAITLLAIEIKIPELHDYTDETAIDGFLHLIPRFLGFFISFFVIGVYWIAHHKIFSYVSNYDRKLLWLNLFLLMFVVLMPFTTGFFFEYTYIRFPFLLYSLNILVIGFFQSRLLQHIVSASLSEGINQQLKKYISYRGLATGTVFTIIALLQYLVPDKYVGITRFAMPLSMLPFYFLKKYFAKHGVDVKNY
jgi:uncharacterized membrane protein